MSERGTTAWSFSETYCCFSREPSLASMLNFTDPADSVAEYSFTGIDTRPKLSDREAIERAAMTSFLGPSCTELAGGLRCGGTVMVERTGLACARSPARGVDCVVPATHIQWTILGRI